MAPMLRSRLKPSKQAKQTPSLGKKQSKPKVADKKLSVPSLPPELVLMILQLCDGPTIIACERVSKGFQALVRGRTLQQATFGVLPQNVMIKIMQHVYRSEYVDLKPNHWNCDEYEGGYFALMSFDLVNTTYNALTHRHPWLASRLYRRSKALAPADCRTVSTKHFSLHPVFSYLTCSINCEIGDIGIWCEAYDDWLTLLNTSAIDEYATMPPTTVIRFEPMAEWGYKKIENKKGVTVRDMMEVYCAEYTEEEPMEGHVAYAGIVIESMRAGVLQLGVNHDS